MTDCRYLAGLAADAARNVATSDLRAGFLTRTCPCEDCAEWRASRKRAHAVRMPALPWWTPYPSPALAPPDAATCPYHGMRRAVMAPRETVAFDAGVIV